MEEENLEQGLEKDMEEGLEEDLEEVLEQGQEASGDVVLVENNTSQVILLADMLMTRLSLNKRYQSHFS